MVGLCASVCEHSNLCSLAGKLKRGRDPLNTIFNFQPSNQGSRIKIKQGKKAIDDVGDGPELVGKGRFENLL